MSRFSVLALVCACGLLLTTSAPADDPKPAKKADKVERILDTLAQEVAFKEGANINDIPLFELLTYLSKTHDFTFLILEEEFKIVDHPSIKEDKPKLAAALVRGLSVHQILTRTLDSMGATYLVKNGLIEIVPVSHAAKVTKSLTRQDQSGRERLNEPLVSAIFKEKPLNEAAAKIAEMYDLTVVVAPQAGDARTGFVSARLLNVPADKALELLALQADLRVVRRGAAYLITSKEHAIELFNEKLDKERQLIELEKFREAPVKPPVPPEKNPEK